MIVKNEMQKLGSNKKPIIKLSDQQRKTVNWSPGIQFYSLGIYDDKI